MGNFADLERTKNGLERTKNGPGTDQEWTKNELDDEEFTPDSVQLTRRVKHLNNTLNHFWNRWRTEYLNELREAHKYSMAKTHTDKKPNLSVGDVVIVHSERLPRGLWKLGRIQELLQGRDGHCRGAVVRTMTKDGQPVLLRRPIQLLYPLEVGSLEPATEKTSDPMAVMLPSEKSPTEADGEGTIEEDMDTTHKPLRRSRRVAAQQGDERRKACMFELDDD